MRNLPLKAFKKSIVESESKDVLYWYLKYYGKLSYIDSKIYIDLWLYEVKDNLLPVKKFGKKSIKIKVEAHNTIIYTHGSIYDKNGDFVREPNSIDSNLQEFTVELHKDENYREKGLYGILQKTFYELVPYEHKLYFGYPYYFCNKIINNKIVEIIIPLQVIVNYFFFGKSSNLNNKILRGEIEKIIKRDGVSKEIDERDGILKIIGFCSFDKQFYKSKDAKNIASYFFTYENSGLHALRLLSESHITDFRNGITETYLKGKLPFYYKTHYNVLGQFIDTECKVFMVSKILGFMSNESNWSVDAIKIKIDNDNKSTGKYENNNEINVNRPNHSYAEVGNITDEPTDHSSQIKQIKIQSYDNDFFASGLDFEILRNDLNKNKYNVEGIQGKHFDSGSTNYDDNDNESSTTREDYIKEEAYIFPWDKCAIKALSYLCKMYQFTGEYISLNNSNNYIPIDTFFENKEIFSIYKSGTQEFIFILFEILCNDNYYYYFDNGKGKCSAIFYRWVNGNRVERMNINQLNDVINKTVKDHDLRWSSIRAENKLVRDNVKVMQPMKHSSIYEKNVTDIRVKENEFSKNQEEKQTFLILQLVSKIKNRLKLKKRK